MANQIKKRNGYNTCWWFQCVTNRVTNRVSDVASEHFPLMYITSPDYSKCQKWNLFDAFKKYLYDECIL